MRVLVYWLARLGIFFVVAGFLWFVVNWQDIISLIASFVLAWLIGYLLLPHLRRDAAAQMDGWLTRSKQSIRDADAEEDAEVGGLQGDANGEHDAVEEANNAGAEEHRAE